MPVRFRLTTLAILLAAGLAAASDSRAQSFEELIESILGQGGETPEPAQPEFPPVPGAPPAMPGAPGVPPGTLVPVEPGPRPYTPPKVDRPPEENAPTASASPAPAATTTEPSSDTSVPGATAPAPVAGAETPAGAATPAPTGGPSVAAPTADPNAAPVPLGAEAPVVERTRESLTVEEVNAAILPPELPAWKGANPLVLKAQVMLDRAGASPGVIDAYSGGNFSKAIAAVESVLGLPVDGVLDKDVWDALGGDSAPAVLIKYGITAEDLSYPFVPVPAELIDQARLPALAYSSLEEMLSERFHMDPKLLAALNPNADFRSTGTEIWVAAIDAPPITDQVARIVADKERRQLRAYDAANHLIAAYPATIGSEQNPSPIGEHIVAAVLRDPVYEYESPSFFGDASQRIALAPGPNNPMGTALIDLGEPGYSIHGAPEPSQVGKGATLGCVRLTNWDAEELAGIIQPGIIVSFQ